MGFRHANLHLPHTVIAEFPEVSSSSRAIPIMLPPFSINLGRLECTITQLSSARTSWNCQKLPETSENCRELPGTAGNCLVLLETAGNCLELCNSYISNGDWRGSNPFVHNTRIAFQV